MFDNSALVLLDDQSVVANSTLVYPESKRSVAIRDAAMLSLLKTGKIDAHELMLEAQCNFEELGPILDTVAKLDKDTREYSFKTMKESVIDEEAQQTFQHEANKAAYTKKLES